jgi:uncharacterized protein (TIGR02145 family)
VDVSNLVVNAGTVTFDVSWKNTGMPAVWSDSVWVWVDHSDAGVMRRLPLAPGATLTATSAPGAGVVEQLPDNNKGVWVIGNARHTGSFSATVQLLTASTGGSQSRPLHGACAYASNYRPTGKYTSITDISFTGMPPYALVLKRADGATYTAASLDGSYVVQEGDTVELFTDKTGAPGTFTCVRPTITTQPAANTNICVRGAVQLSVGADNAHRYRWKKNGADVTDGAGGTTANYTTAVLTANATYTVVVSNGLSACSATSDNALATVYARPIITTQPRADSDICYGNTFWLRVEADNATAWQWKKDGVDVPGGTDGTDGKYAYYVTESITGGTTYTVVVSNGFSACSITSRRALVTVSTKLYTGSIVTDLAAVPVGIPPMGVVESLRPASGGRGKLTYLWARTGASAATLTGRDATYALNKDMWNYIDVGTYYFNRYTIDAGCNIIDAAAGTYTLKVFTPGDDQPQGSCTFTPREVVSTFAGFDRRYSASTYVVLTDERDNKNYPVVKLNGRWIMARNLNYQKGLTWQMRANQPSTGKGLNPALIGHFWCPAGENFISETYSTKASCDVWGALYSWETAMSFDGKGAWTEASSTYCTGAANTTNCKRNHGHTSNGSTGGRGICPPNWHVPTDYEWGIILDGMESAGGKAHQNADTIKGGFGSDNGIDAGSRGKAKCTCPATNLDCIDDTKVNWTYYARRDGTPYGAGTDNYGFRALPAGLRRFEYFYSQGAEAFFWSSSLSDSEYAWFRSFVYYRITVGRAKNYRSYGHSVRCIRD